MANEVINLLGSSSSVTLTLLSPTTTARTLTGPLAQMYVLYYTIEGVTGDAGDAAYPVLQTSFDGGSNWAELQSGPEVAGGVAATSYTLVPQAIGAYAGAGISGPSEFAFPFLGNAVRLRLAVTDPDLDASWRLTRARLARY